MSTSSRNLLEIPLPCQSSLSHAITSGDCNFTITSQKSVWQWPAETMMAKAVSA
jgi:hypothetical protein